MGKVRRHVHDLSLEVGSDAAFVRVHFLQRNDDQLSPGGRGGRQGHPADGREGRDRYLAIVAALANSNGGLYAALAAEYGDATDVGAVSILSINDGPFFTMLALGAAGAANIPLSVLLGCIIPVIVGCILGNLDDDIRKFCEPGATMLIPFFAFPLGAGLNIFNLVKAGAAGVLLGLGCLLVTGLGGFAAYKLLRLRHPEVGAAIGATAGNAAATPLAVAAVDATLLAVAETATAQITAAIIVTAIGCPLLVSFLHRFAADAPNDDAGKKSSE